MDENFQTDKIKQIELDIYSQNVFFFIELKNKIYNVRVELSKSTNLISEEGSKTKKSERKKLKPKTELALLILFPIQTQSTLVNLKSSDTNK